MKHFEKIASAVPSVKSHPGEVLLNKFMKPLGLSGNRLAAALHVPGQRVAEIVNARRRITADTALRLSKFFGTTPKFWLDLQADYELRQAEEKWASFIERQIRPIDLSKCDFAASLVALEVEKTESAVGNEGAIRNKNAVGRKNAVRKENDARSNRQGKRIVQSKRLVQSKSATLSDKPDRALNDAALEGNEKKVYDLLSQEPISFEELCRRTGLSAAKMGVVVVTLELANLIKRLPGDAYSI